jgi:hypothetical protein
MIVEAHASELRAIAENSNAWPFEEARKILTRLEHHPKDEVIFKPGGAGALRRAVGKPRTSGYACLPCSPTIA